MNIPHLSVLRTFAMLAVAGLLLAACAAPTPRPAVQPAPAPTAVTAAGSGAAPVAPSKPGAVAREGEPASAPAAQNGKAASLPSAQSGGAASVLPPTRPASPASPPAAPDSRGPQPSAIAGMPSSDRAPIEPTAAAPIVPPAADNVFKDYGVNPFVETARDRLSTFALDVDTASYDITRKYIASGALPPYSAVRVEEFVNSFGQGYPSPTDSVFGVFADGAVSPFHSDGSYLLRIGVQAYRLPDFARKPASFVFVIDESGSMADGNRIDLARNAVKALVRRLHPTDSVGIVAFTDSVRVIIDPTPASQTAEIFNAVDRIRPQNTTNVEAGLATGYKMAASAFRAGGINRVVLISDGVANQGGLRPEEILRSVQEYARRGIQLTTVGVGFGNYNDVLMETLADKSEGGNYMVLNNAQDIERSLVARLAGLQMVADDAKVQIDFNPQTVSYYRLLGYENRAVNDADFRNDHVGGGGIGAGHTSTAIYQVKLRSEANGRLATVNVRWQDPDSRKAQEINGDVRIADLGRRFEEANPRFQLAATVAQFAEILRRSPYAGDTSLRDLTLRAGRISEQLADDPAAGEFAALVSRAAQIAR